MKLPMEPDHSAEIASLRVAKAQLIVALKIMRAANNALGCGDEEALRMMNFSQEHIAELKSRWAGGKLGESLPDVKTFVQKFLIFFGGLEGGLRLVFN